MNRNEIFKIYGTDHKEMTVRLLKACALASDIRDHSARIGIKPNLVTPSPASFGATTHPEIVSGIIEYLRSEHFENIVILESAWIGDKTSEAFEYCGYYALSRKYGVPLIDTKRDKGVKTDCSGMELNICRSFFDIDFLINVPVLKGHCQTKMTCALKNMKGLIPDSEKRRFHTMGLHRPIAHLNSVTRQDFIVVDNICGDPYFEEGGSPMVSNCIMAAKDPVLTDAHACSLLGYNISDVPYLGLAECLNIGSTDLSSLKISILGGETAVSYSPDDRVLDVSYAADDVDACSACYAMLIPALIRLKDKGLLERLPSKIAIGQGHRGRTGRIGIGSCTKNFAFSIKGCPPSEEDIYKGLRDYILKL